MSGYRNPYEFNGDTRRKVWNRSGGDCEWLAEPCGDKAVTIDHLTSLQINKALNGGVIDKSVKNLENAQALCRWHDEFKRLHELWFLKELRNKGSSDPASQRRLLTNN